MSDRELIAIMAAVLRAGNIANGEVVSSLPGSVDEAEKLLAEIDARTVSRSCVPQTPPQASTL